MTLVNQILMFQERNVTCFFINTPRLTKDQRVSIWLEYARVNNARDSGGVGQVSENERVLSNKSVSKHRLLHAVLIFDRLFLANSRHFQKWLLKFKRSSLGQYCTKMHRAYVKI